MRLTNAALAVLLAAGISSCSGGSATVPSIPAQQPTTEQNTVSLPSLSTRRLGASQLKSNSTTITQKHILTADYLGSPYGSSSVSASAAAPYLTWAQVGINYANAVHNAGIKTQLYVDPNVSTNNGDPLYSANETTFAHTCGGSRIAYSYDGHTMYVMNIGASTMRSLFAGYVSQIRSLAHYDAVWEDNAGPLNGVPVTSFPCNYSASNWVTYGENLNAASPIPVMSTGLEDLYNHGMSYAVYLLDNSNTFGGNYEHCYTDTGTPKVGGWIWQVMEETEINVVARGKAFECQMRNTNAASSSTDARIYALASFLLTYNPATSILWEEFQTPSRFHVLPESGLVLESPTTSVSSLSSIHTSGGTYARQYSACYWHGYALGGCAVVVNSDSVSHPFPYTAYHHSLVVSGSGVSDGGTISDEGPAPSSTLPALEARIVFP